MKITLVAGNRLTQDHVDAWPHFDDISISSQLGT